MAGSSAKPKSSRKSGGTAPEKTPSAQASNAPDDVNPDPTPEQERQAEQARLTPAEAEATAADQRNRADDQATEQREQAAKDSRSQVEASLKAGQDVGKGMDDWSGKTIPEQREAGQPGVKPTAGRVDNMTKRHDGDPLQGHFVYIDYSDSDVADRVKQQLAPEGSALAGQGFEPGLGSADYGVYLQPSQVDPDTGYPELAIVLLRDEHAAQVVVPFDALKPAPQGGRR